MQPTHPPPAPRFGIRQTQPRCAGLPQLTIVSVGSGLRDASGPGGPCAHTCARTHVHTPQTCLLPPSASKKSCHGDIPSERFWGHQFRSQPGLNRVVCPAGNMVQWEALPASPALPPSVRPLQNAQFPPTPSQPTPYVTLLKFILQMITL